VSPTPLSSTATRPDTESALGDEPFLHLLKTWRKKRRLSQLELAMTSGVSQRHISFLESGRAKPSRSMILRLSECLEVPLRGRNEWLIAAGFAPMFRARSLDDPMMDQVMSAVERMLDNHAPFPAVAIDRAWNIRRSNAPFDRLTAMLGPDVWGLVGGGERNLMRLIFHPGGVQPWVTNWNTIAPLLWHRAQREAEAWGGQPMGEILEELGPFQDEALLWASDEAPLLPVLPLEIEREGVRISLFTVIATFGTAQDVTTDELRIESLFPADEATESLFLAMAAD
jgi:transcriptional regulator with XRE-family HTH domain